MVTLTACVKGSNGTQEDAMPEALGQDPALATELEPLVQAVMDRGLIPGLQVAVVTADGRRWMQGFGVVDVTTGQPVTPNTRFYIASTTKVLTGLAAVQLHHRGILDLDIPIADALPEARFPTDYEADVVTVRDFLTHTHGLRQAPSSFRIAFTGDYTNELIFDLLATHRVLPGRTFNYSNLSYDVVGLAMDPATTGGWKSVVSREVLEPLGMRHTTAYRSRVPDSLLAWPHRDGASGMERIDLRKHDENMGPAGGYFSTAGDLARLLEVELLGGLLGGKQVVPAAVIAETQRAQVPQQREFLHYRRHSWGIGWDIGIYDGDTVVHRPGGFAGYYANAAFMPDHGFGVAVLSNGGSVGARVAEIAAAAIYDRMRGKDDVVERLSDRLDAVEERIAAARARREQDGPEFATKPTHPSQTFVGTYISERWGTIEVSLEQAPGRGLTIRSGVATAELRPLAGSPDLFWTDLIFPDQVQFTVEGGRAVELRLQGLSAIYIRVARASD
jgi:CubicO group peptidase (beta-lactamase class C family)